MSAASRPRSGSSPSIDEMTPRVKLEPVGLVKTVRPWARSTATSILVVVVLPLVPLTTTIPPRHVGQGVGEEPGVDPLGHQAGQRRAAATQARGSPRRLARDHRRRRPQHAPNPSA